MPRLTASDIKGYRRPEPLAEDFPLGDLGGDVRIQGLTTKEQYDAIQAEIALHKEGANGLKAALGYVPKDGEIVQAAYVSACVTEPPLTVVEWLQFNAQGFTFLPTLFSRVLVCSRLSDDKDKDDKTTTPDGVEAADRELKESGDSDPLDPAGSASV